MKKIAVMLLLSFLAGMVNAATMPIISGKTTHVTEPSVHSHCDEVVTTASQDDSDSVGKLNVSHYCCSAIAVLGSPLSFSLLEASDFHLLGEISKPISNITESIYKPPRNYL